jgi:hypothetical protein
MKQRYVKYFKENILDSLKNGDKIIINLTQNEEKFGIHYDKTQDEEVILLTSFNTGANKDRAFVKLLRKHGAPYTITSSKLKMVFVKKI